MSIDCAFFGFVAADVEAKTSKTGKPWVHLRVGVGHGDAVQWASVAVFGKAVDTAVTLKKSDRVYIEGAIKIHRWRGNDGVERHGLSVAAFKCDRTHQIGRNRSQRHNDDNAAPEPRADTRPNDFHDDKIPF